jgi:hypothetical protein
MAAVCRAGRRPAVPIGRRRPDQPGRACQPRLDKMAPLRSPAPLPPPGRPLIFLPGAGSVRAAPVRAGPRPATRPTPPSADSLYGRVHDPPYPARPAPPHPAPVCSRTAISCTASSRTAGSCTGRFKTCPPAGLLYGISRTGGSCTAGSCPCGLLVRPDSVRAGPVRAGPRPAPPRPTPPTLPLL